MARGANLPAAAAIHFTPAAAAELARRAFNRPRRSRVLDPAALAPGRTLGLHARRAARLATHLAPAARHGPVARHARRLAPR